MSDYTTNFGIPQFVGQDGFPELTFSLLVSRQFENAFFINVVPLLVVLLLTFGALLTVTRYDNVSNRLGYNVSAIIATVSALFFVALLSHIQLRQELPGVEVTYMEYFYMITYVALLVIAINAFYVSSRPAYAESDGLPDDNLLVKLLYWPLILFGSIVVTIVLL